MSQLDLRQLQQTVHSLRDELEKSAANIEREVQKERVKYADEIEQLKTATQAVRDALEESKHEADKLLQQTQMTMENENLSFAILHRRFVTNWSVKNRPMFSQLTRLSRSLEKRDEVCKSRFNN